jgi:adenine/guanine phosphoribosyltransferase-like PRPP-binding protein
LFVKDEHLANSFFNCCQDVAHEIAGELQANPDLIIGNYSDGNLVACLLAHKMGVTHV